MRGSRKPLVVFACSLLVAACERPTNEEIVHLDALTLRAEVASGRLSAVRVIEAFLERIAMIDDAGPTLGAVIEVNPAAVAIARELDEHRARGATLGPLHGVPVLVKANIDTGDAMATSAGSLALAEHRAERDADVVMRLREAGAVLLGKTNLSEWANFRSTSSTSGWSSLGGQTRNPWVLDRSPCGSSSGAAVAVAARLAPLALGTETDGSIVCPAGTNGVVGLKPSHGLVSARGIVPLAASQDTVGLLARSAADAALALEVITGSNAAPTPFAQNSAPSGLRIGVVRDYSGAGRDAAVEGAFERALRQLRNTGTALIDPVPLELPADVGRAEMVVLLGEFRDQVGDYLSRVGRGPRTLTELIAFNERHAREVMPYFGQDLLLAARDSAGVDATHYKEAVAVLERVPALLMRAFAEHRLDALVVPSNARAWRIDYRNGDAVGVSSSRLAAVSGYPSVSIPAELAAELPLGITFIGLPGQERALLEIATRFESVRGSFPEPRFLASSPD